MSGDVTGGASTLVHAQFFFLGSVVACHRLGRSPGLLGLVTREFPAKSKQINSQNKGGEPTHCYFFVRHRPQAVGSPQADARD